MRLNPDCIRALLFAVEEISTIDSFITSDQLSKSTNLSKYSNDEILYHLNQLCLSGYVIVPQDYRWIDGTLVVRDLSPAGHEFISNIRKDTNWNKVKKIGNEIGVNTLSSIKTIAEEVIASAIKTSIGLN